MTVSFFSPQTKIHKQRAIMRDTDLRLVYYSKRGIVLSLVIFVIGMILGDYYSQQTIPAIVFAVGIVISTALRSYYLFFFDTIYARAPSRWRNIYFTITIIGAMWWGLMLAAVTYEVGLQSETPLLWLYTIAFFSSCSHVFSPYKHFYNIYILVSLLPCSLVAILSLHPLESLYGAIMLGLFVLLREQGCIQGDAYWDRLQATYESTQRANALKAENITSQSTLSDKDTLFMNVAGELKKSLREIMGSLQLLKMATLSEEDGQLVSLAKQKGQQQMQMLQNILEFSQISKKEVILNLGVIDLRASIEKAVSSISETVYKKKHELLIRFSPDFPVRVKGDIERIEQMLINMISSAVDYVDKGELLLDVTYTAGSETSGQLNVSINIENPLRTPEIELQLYNVFKPHYANDMSQGLSLAIAKGLANCMAGNAGANFTPQGQLRFWFNANLSTVTPANSSTHNILKLNGKRLLLYQPPRIIEDEYKHNLEAWGLVVDVVYDDQTAIAAIKHAQSLSMAFDLIMIYTQVNNLQGTTLAQQIVSMGDVSLPQLICVTEAQSKLPVIQKLLGKPRVDIILKPLTYKQLRKFFKASFTNESTTEVGSKEDFLKNKKVLLLQIEEIDRTIAEVMLRKLGCIVFTVNTPEQAIEQFSSVAFDIFITDCHLTNVNMKEFIELAKKQNQVLHNSGYVLPILGMGYQDQEAEETHCLQSGMNYYIDSPLQIDDLRAILRRWIGRAVHIAETSDKLE